jgi:signal transduction histidine kinase
MTALELISLVNQLLFIGLFVAVLWRAVRRPSSWAWNTVLLFGSLAAAIAIALASRAAGVELPGWATGFALLLLNLVPLAMMRLVADFSGVPRAVLLAAHGAFVVLGLFGFVGLTEAPRAYELAVIAWFLIVGGYAALAFGRAAVASTGITRRRMTAVVAGAILFIGAFVSIFLGALVQPLDIATLAQLLALGSALAFFVGFTPPGWLRSAWREPDLRRFLEDSIHLAGIAEDRRVMVELQAAAAAAFGAGGAAVGIFDPERGVLRYVAADGEWVEYPTDAFVGGRAFSEGRRLLIADAPSTDPGNADVYERAGARAVIAAPLEIDGRRLGAVSIYAERAPIFAEDDLTLLELIADQSAILLESRARAADERSVNAREETARLKEEFLSAAAHDLRTPLTVILGQAELLERRLQRDPAAPIDAASVARLTREARRLSTIVTELLDAQRLEQGSSPVALATGDLREVVAAVQHRLHDQGLDVKVTLPDMPVTGAIDRLRLEQVLDNLVENALKYTIGGRLPELDLAVEGDELRVRVVDHGIGIPEAERSRVFERFYRASNTGGTADTGMGLGLFICRRIVDAHGGRIWVEPTDGGGSTFVVALTAERQPEPMQAPAPLPLPGTEALGDV